MTAIQTASMIFKDEEEWKAFARMLRRKNLIHYLI